MQTLTTPAILHRPTKKVNFTSKVDDLLRILFVANFGSFVAVSYKADMDDSLSSAAKKSGVKVYKTSHFRARLGKDYEALVKAHLVKNGKNPDDFTAMPMKNGTWIEGWEGRVLESSTGKIQARVNLDMNYIPTVEWELNGKECEYGDIEPYLQPSKRTEAKAQAMEATAERQGVQVDEAVHPRCLTLSQILRVKADGMEWTS